LNHLMYIILPKTLVLYENNFFCSLSAFMLLLILLLAFPKFLEQYTPVTFLSYPDVRDYCVFDTLSAPNKSRTSEIYCNIKK
jgi:hypothetical protein